MTNEQFIAEFEEKAKYVQNVIELAKGGHVEASEDPEPTLQQQCYAAHAGQCGTCSTDGSWESCG